MTEAKQRRTQAERSAGTRAALLDAAIRMLYEHGYGTTTTMLVAEQAGVSRGAMLHQFRTKADLMTYVVEAVYEEELERYFEIRPIGDPKQLVLAYPQIIWDVLSRPSGVAVLEILQGSRSDTVLADKLAPIQARIEQDALDRLRRMSGFGPEGFALMRLLVWAVRGLSVARVLAPEPEGVAESIQLLSRLIEAGLDTGVIHIDAESRTGIRDAKGEAEQKSNARK